MAAVYLALVTQQAQPSISAIYLGDLSRLHRALAAELRFSLLRVHFGAKARDLELVVGRRRARL